jgi:hypothetical protein
MFFKLNFGIKKSTYIHTIWHVEMNKHCISFPNNWKWKIAQSIYERLIYLLYLSMDTKECIILLFGNLELHFRSTT